MNWFEAIFLGFLQGLTEFLPISSSAHLRIAGELLPGAQDPGAAFTAITQLGTETAVAVYFWKDIVRIVKAWFGSLAGRVPRSDPDARMGWLIIVGTLPIVILGLLFQDQIESTFRSLWIVATMLIVFGVILAVADAVGKQQRNLDQLTYKHGILYGFAQALALIPGVSRSGGTITAGLLMGYTREAAARYAFLLAIPAVFGSGLYQLAKSWGRDRALRRCGNGAGNSGGVRRRLCHHRLVPALRFHPQLPALCLVPDWPRRRDLHSPGLRRAAALSRILTPRK